MITDEDRVEGAKTQLALVLGSLVAKLGLSPVTAAASLLGASLMIRDVGADGYGAISVYAGLVQMLPFLDFGIGASIVDLTGRYGTGGPVRTAVRRAAVMLSRVSVGLVALAVLLAVTGGWRSLLGPGVEAVGGAGLAGAMFVSVFALSVPLSLGQRVLLGLGKQPAALACGTAGSIASTVAVVLIYGTGAPRILYVITVPLGLIIGAGLTAFIAAREFPKTGRSEDPIGAERVAFSGLAAPMFVVMVCVPVALHSDRIVLSHLVADRELGRYALAYQLYLPLYTAIAAGLTTLWPHFTQRKATGKDMHAAWRSALTLAAVIGGGSGLLLAGTLRPAAALVSGGRVDVPLGLVASIAALLVVQVLHYPSAMSLMDPEGLRLQASLSAGMLALNVPLSILLARTVGVWGPVAASGISVSLAQLLPTLELARRRFRRSTP